MNAFTPALTEDHKKRPPMASRFIQANSIPWESTRYEGIQTKTLLVEPSSGLLTLLMKMEQGAVLPDHEHVQIEQTWILNGSLVCDEGSCHAGEFVWRPAGSRHKAWAGPEGVTLLGMFLMPNKFFEANGSEVDFLGEDWNKKWAAANERKLNALFD